MPVRGQTSQYQIIMTQRLIVSCTTVVLLLSVHMCSGLGFCMNEPVPYCTCHPSTLSVNCSGRNVTKLPSSYQQSLLILNIKGANLEVLESVPYDHLTSLSLENCGIWYIKSGALDNLAHLNYLYFTNNEITGLTNTTFAGMKNLSVIKLSLNPLYVLKRSVFSHTQTPNLTEIRLEECLLYEVESRAFAMLNQLAYLNLSFNYLRSVPVFHEHDKLNLLHTLDLSGNQIQTLAASGLGFLKNLQTLLMHTNHMERVTRRDTQGLHNNLRFLDLSKNQISWIEATAFTEMNVLSELYLDGNLIRSLYWEEMPWGSLNKLTLMNNPWECSCNNSWMVEDNYPYIKIVNNNENTK